MLREQLVSYLERARTSKLEASLGPDGSVRARVDDEVVRVFGLKMLYRERRSIYEFRKFGEHWWIWGIDELEAIPSPALLPGPQGGPSPLIDPLCLFVAVCSRAGAQGATADS